VITKQSVLFRDHNNESYFLNMLLAVFDSQDGRCDQIRLTKYSFVDREDLVWSTCGVSSSVSSCRRPLYVKTKPRAAKPFLSALCVSKSLYFSCMSSVTRWTCQSLRKPIITPNSLIQRASVASRIKANGLLCLVSTHLYRFTCLSKQRSQLQ